MSFGTLVILAVIGFFIVCGISAAIKEYVRVNNPALYAQWEEEKRQRELLEKQKELMEEERKRIQEERMGNAVNLGVRLAQFWFNR